MRRLAKAAGFTVAAAAAAVVAEKVLIAAPKYRGRVSDHFDGEHFFNPGEGWEPHASVVRWAMTRIPTPWPEWIDSEPGPAPESLVEDGRVRITWVNHATMLIQMDGANILTDPIWSDRCSPVSWAGPQRHRVPGIVFDELPPLDAILVSHNHYDHMDLPTLRHLVARGAGLQRRAPSIVTPLGNSALLRQHGVRGAYDLDWWRQIQISERVFVTLVPARHFCARGISDRNRTLWGGFIISGPSGNVYFAGDSGWGDHFEEIGRRFGPIRVAMLPIGAYEPRWFMCPAHICPGEAIDAHFALGAKTSIAMHFGTFALGDDGHVEPVLELEAVKREKGNPPVMVLEHGIGFDAP